MDKRKKFNAPLAKYRQNNLGLIPRAERIGYFSVDGDRNYLSGASKLLYYNPPLDKNVTLDLDVGREIAVRRTDSFKVEGIELLLKWIIKNQEKIKASPDTNKWIEPNFVCSRGLLIRLFTAPYLPSESWTIHAAKWKGTIYLRALEDVKHLSKIDPVTNIKYASWGHKFEQYVLSDSPNTAPDTLKPVIEPEEFRVVFKQRISKYTVLFSTVMKGVCSKKLVEEPLNLDDLEFIDLKTSRIIEHAGNERTLRRNKFLKWWIMGSLTDTEKVLCGFRDDNGIVSKMATYTLKEMVSMSRNFWQPAECIACCETFLKELAESMIEECDKTIYEFTKVSHEDFNIVELTPTAENRVLPLWYMEAMG